MSQKILTLEAGGKTVTTYQNSHGTHTPVQSTPFQPFSDVKNIHNTFDLSPAHPEMNKSQPNVTTKEDGMYSSPMGSLGMPLGYNPEVMDTNQSKSDTHGEDHSFYTNENDESMAR